jgi:hypothetical protein
VTMGDPMRPLMWVSKSQEKLAVELVALAQLSQLAPRFCNFVGES